MTSIAASLLVIPFQLQRGGKDMAKCSRMFLLVPNALSNCPLAQPLVYPIQYAKAA